MFRAEGLFRRLFVGAVLVVAALPVVLAFIAPLGELLVERLHGGFLLAEGWCDRPAPAAKPGQIVIYYARDAHGACTAGVDRSGSSGVGFACAKEEAMADEDIFAARPKGYVTGPSSPLWWAGTTIGNMNVMFQMHHPDHGWLTFFFPPDDADRVALALLKGSAMVREAARALALSTVTEN